MSGTDAPRPAIDIDTVLGALGHAPCRVRGRSRLCLLSPTLVACAPLSLRPAQVTARDALVVPVAALDAAGQGAAMRFALALRQRAWRHLQGRRGLVPLAVVQTAPGAAAIAACWLDGAAASPGTLDALGKIFDDAALRHDLAWATRARA